MAIEINKERTGVSGLADDDVIQPFSLEQTNVRGRMVRLGKVLEEIMRRHKYPLSVCGLLSEIVTLAVLLSGMLKYEGIFSLQIKSDGIIRNLTSDVTSEGEVRAYADFDEEKLKDYTHIKDTYYDLLGKGYMSFTVQSNVKSEHSYQGIVALQGKSLLDDVAHYFDQSEQIKTLFKISVHPQDGYWHTGGIMIQQMPEDEPESKRHDEKEREDWNNAGIMLASCTDEEILSPVLSSSDVLYRLFHEGGVRVYNHKDLKFGCRCSKEKVEAVMATISKEEIFSIYEQEKIVSVKCEFCSEEYNLNLEDLTRIYSKKENKVVEEV